MPRTGYFGGEDWEGGGQLYKPIHIYKIKLCEIMFIAGIGDDEDLALYDTEEAQIAPGSHSPAPLEMNTQQSPVSQPQTASQQSQLITQLRSPPQIPLQVFPLK
jgi:hypothetical protein